LLTIQPPPPQQTPPETFRQIHSSKQTNPKHTHTNETSQEFHVPRRKMVAVMMLDLVWHWTRAALNLCRVEGLGFRRRRRRRSVMMYGGSWCKKISTEFCSQ
jgi:hypothetical protein